MTLKHQLKIHRADAQDVQAFKQIRLEALKLEPASYASSYDSWANLPDEEWVRRMQQPVFIAYDGDDPVGLTGLMRQSSAKMTHRASIIMVYVRESHRRAGIAAALLEAAKTAAKADGIIQLELAVSAENEPAIRFYLHEGFTEIGRIPGGFKHEDREIDDVLMALRIEEPSA